MKETQEYLHCGITNLTLPSVHLVALDLFVKNGKEVTLELVDA
jgi:hypothetical protein